MSASPSSSWRELLPLLLGHPPGAEGADGFGQSMIDDIRFLARSRRLRRQAMSWRAPTAEEARVIEADAFLGRFADSVTAVSWADGLACVVLERTWHGFPDPPQYALFAMRDGEIEIAADFDDWPEGWRIEPAGPSLPVSSS